MTERATQAERIESIEESLININTSIKELQDAHIRNKDTIEELKKIVDTISLIGRSIIWLAKYGSAILALLSLAYFIKTGDLAKLL